VSRRLVLCFSATTLHACINGRKETLDLHRLVAVWAGETKVVTLVWLTKQHEPKDAARFGGGRSRCIHHRSCYAHRWGLCAAEGKNDGIAVAAHLDDATRACSLRYPASGEHA
jgi:hypothetical protein